MGKAETIISEIRSKYSAPVAEAMIGVANRTTDYFYLAVDELLRSRGRNLDNFTPAEREALASYGEEEYPQALQVMLDEIESYYEDNNEEGWWLRCKIMMEKAGIKAARRFLGEVE